LYHLVTLRTNTKLIAFKQTGNDLYKYLYIHTRTCVYLHNIKMTYAHIWDSCDDVTDHSVPLQRGGFGVRSRPTLYIIIVSWISFTFTIGWRLVHEKQRR